MLACLVCAAVTFISKSSFMRLRPLLECPPPQAGTLRLIADWRGSERTLDLHGCRPLCSPQAPRNEWLSHARACGGKRRAQRQQAAAHASKQGEHKVGVRGGGCARARSQVESSQAVPLFGLVQPAGRDFASVPNNAMSEPLALLSLRHQLSRSSTGPYQPLVASQTMCQAFGLSVREQIPSPILETGKFLRSSWGTPSPSRS